MPIFPGSIRSKLPKVETTIFSVMSQLATEQNAINLSQGFPDFYCSPELVALVDKYMKLGYNQYAQMPGYIGLREAISEKVKSLCSSLNIETISPFSPSSSPQEDWDLRGFLMEERALSK